MSDQRRVRLTRRRAAAIACLIAAGALLSGCGKGKEKEAAGAGRERGGTPVMVESAVRGAIDHMVAADAVLYPINQANVTPKITLL